MSTTYNHLKKYITRHSIVNQDTNEVEKKREFEKQKKKKRISLYVNTVGDVTPLFTSGIQHIEDHVLYLNTKKTGITKITKLPEQQKITKFSKISSVLNLGFAQSIC